MRVQQRQVRRGDGTVTRIDVRSFHVDDTPALLRVWDSAYCHYAGWVPRTPTSWSWNILARPDVRPTDILVGTLADRAVGYAVPTDRGTVLEFAVAGDLRLRDRANVARLLLVELEARLQARGIGSLQLDVPAEDRVLGRVLAGRGYRSEPERSQILLIVNAVELLGQILRHRAAEVASLGLRAAMLELEPGRYRFCPDRRVLVTLAPEPAVSVAGPEAEAECTIRLSMETLAEIILQRRDPVPGVAAGQIIVAPADRVLRALGLLRMLTVRAPWYVPYGDTR